MGCGKEQDRDDDDALEVSLTERLDGLLDRRRSQFQERGLDRPEWLRLAHVLDKLHQLSLAAGLTGPMSNHQDSKIVWEHK
jgi:hypothetical protein